MDGGKVLQLFLLFLGLNLHPVCGVSHSLRFNVTAVKPATNSPEYTAVVLVDGEQVVYYDSNNMKMIPKTEWVKKIVDDDRTQYWDAQKEYITSDQERLRVCLTDLIQNFSQTGGVHTLQNIFGCEEDDDGTSRGYSQFGYDGEDICSLDLNNRTWTSLHPKADVITQTWGEGFVKDTLQNECIEWLKEYVNYRRPAPEKRVPPKTELIQKNSSSSQEVRMSLQKNKEEVHEDVELRETVPNKVGTFWERTILTVLSENPKNKYSFVIEHSGVKNEIPLTEIRVLNDGGSDGGSAGGSAGVMIVILYAVVAVQLVVIGSLVGLIIWKKKRSNIWRPWATLTSDPVSLHPMGLAWHRHKYV